MHLLEKLSSNILENSMSPKVELTKDESSLLNENSQNEQLVSSPVPLPSSPTQSNGNSTDETAEKTIAASGVEKS